MTRTLYDPEVEKRGIEKGREDGIREGLEKGKMEAKLEMVKNLLDILDDETIAEKVGLDIEIVRKLRAENK